MARDPHVIGRVGWPRRRKGRLGHRPGRPVATVAGPAALRYATGELRGRSVVVAQEPSKLLGRVRFPSPALKSTHHGEWRSLVAHPAGGRAVAGSNPVSPIRKSPGKRGLFARLGRPRPRRTWFQFGSNSHAGAELRDADHARRACVSRDGVRACLAEGPSAPAAWDSVLGAVSGLAAGRWRRRGSRLRAAAPSAASWPAA